MPAREPRPVHGVVPYCGALLVDGAYGSGLFGITDQRFRAHWNDNQVFLFDVLEDPGKTRDIASNQPERVQELMQRFETLRASIPPLAAEGMPSKASKKNLQALEALGYGGGEDD